MPRATAAYLTLCNGRLTPQECLQQGIVNKVVPKDKLIETAEGLLIGRVSFAVMPVATATANVVQFLK